MAGHDVDAEQLLRVDHVLTDSPQRRGRSLPRIAAIQQQCAGTRRTKLLHERAQVRITAHRPKRAGGPNEIEIRERMRLARARLDAEASEKRLADDMGRLATRGSDAEIDAGFAEVHGTQLRVRVRDVQQMHVAERPQHVGIKAIPRALLRSASADRQPNGRRGGERLEEFAAGHGPTIC